MRKQIKIAIADDHALLRSGIVSLLQKLEDVVVIGEMGTGEEAVNFAASHNPDIFLIDILMPGMSGVEATRWIKEQTPLVKIILVSSEINKDLISAGIKSGIHGYLSKDIGLDILQSAIHTVIKGDRYFSPEITALVFQDFYLKQSEGKGLPSKKKTTLSKREEQVLSLIATGKSLKMIAEELFISIKTVESHKLNIQDKLGLTNVAQLVKFAIEHSVIEVTRIK